MNFLKNALYLFYPKACVTCETQLLPNEEFICTLCRHDLPIIIVADFKNNKIAASFFGRIPIEMAISFLFYRKERKTKRIIHSLKYKGNQKIETFIGDWFGFMLKKSGEFNTIDCIVPVPLHQKKLKTRGYNQLTTFGTALAKQLNAKYTPTILTRISSASTQTFKQRFERFQHKETTFSLTDTSCFKNKHVLLIDDVITTGATLEACCKELLKSANITISIATIAYTE